MLFVYNLFIVLFRFGVRIASLWNPKAAAWINGRKNLLQHVKDSIAPSDKIIWMHCASVGELEQGKPVIESLKEAYPHHKILVTFFSPSGYQQGIKYGGADHVFYLPSDTKKNALEFIRLVQPKLVVFVKYDFWYHHLKAINQQQIPLLLASSIFRKNQLFFKWYGGFYKKILKLFTCIFVQDKASLDLLHSIEIKNCMISGDTRFDRVSAIIANRKTIEGISSFAKNSNLIVAGSTWPDDEELLSKLMLHLPKNYKLIIAPHEITKVHINKILSLFSKAILYSKLTSDLESQVLVIDNIGMLSQLYQYATITYIGGGFNKSGIHNTLEAAVWSKPVIIGRNYKKFREARDLIGNEGAFSISTTNDLTGIILRLLNDDTELQKSSTAAGTYVQQNKGATQKIMNYIQENRLLTTP